MAPSSMSIFEAVQQIVRPSTEFPFHLSDFEKERILEVYAAGINDQITIEQAAHQGLLQENQQVQFFPATAFSLLKIFESLNDGVLLLDQNGFVRYINKSFERIAQAEKELLKETLQQFDSTVKGKKEVAKHLGISLTTLYDKIKKYNLSAK